MNPSRSPVLGLNYLNEYMQPSVRATRCEPMRPSGRRKGVLTDDILTPVTNPMELWRVLNQENHPTTLADNFP